MGESFSGFQHISVGRRRSEDGVVYLFVELTELDLLSF